CRSRLAGDGPKGAAFIQVTRVIVNDHRWQASSYRFNAIPCRSRLAGDGLKFAAFIQVTRVIVNDPREQARAYRAG
ncbi:hypothetical protein, partial [Pseudomonas jessenii]|uniref:hypothetical protein n=1 Tax=Pseudomonas jessenii TaxID=77298 RepID=UPI0019D4A4D3